MSPIRILLLLVAFMPQAVRAGAAAAPAVAQPAPASAKRGEAKKEYTLIPGDRVQITVTGEQELNRNAQVSPAGTVTLLYIDEVKIADLTIAQAQLAIERQYIEQRYLRRPEVIITIENYAPRLIYFTGEVNKKDAITYPVDSDRPFTLLDAIQKAGVTDSARLTRVRVSRAKPDGTRELLGPFDVEATMRGRPGASDGNFELQPGDQIDVPIRPI